MNMVMVDLCFASDTNNAHIDAQFAWTVSPVLGGQGKAHIGRAYLQGMWLIGLLDKATRRNPLTSVAIHTVCIVHTLHALQPDTAKEWLA